MRRLLTVVLALPIFVLLPAVAFAHPLGNFTINQFLGLHITKEHVDVAYVVDMAEIPAFQERQMIDTDGDDDISSAEQAAYRSGACADRAAGLDIKLDGSGVTLGMTTTRLGFPPGQAGLSTLRLECGYRFGVTGSELTVENSNFSERIGWREIVVTSDGVAAATDLPSESVSARLTSYPQDPAASSPDVRAGAVRIGRGARYEGAPAAVAPSTGLPIDALGSLISQGAPGATTGVVAVLAALALGAAHALAPGHGKTIMSACLLGNRGTVRQALGLGLAVAVSHTVGVLALGLATLFATRNYQPEKIYPYLSAVSGAIVLTIGVVLVIRGRRRWQHDQAHTHGYEHRHDHEPPPVHRPSLDCKALTALGLSGGLVPSASAVVLLLGAVHLGEVEFGLALIAAFGVGMAATLVTVGLGLVAVARFGLKRLPGSAWGERIAAMVPTTMGLVVTVVGLMMIASASRSLVGF